VFGRTPAVAEVERGWAGLSAPGKEKDTNDER